MPATISLRSPRWNRRCAELVRTALSGRWVTNARRSESRFKRPLQGMASNGQRLLDWPMPQWPISKPLHLRLNLPELDLRAVDHQGQTERRRCCMCSRTTRTMRVLVFRTDQLAVQQPKQRRSLGLGQDPRYHLNKHPNKAPSKTKIRTGKHADSKEKSKSSKRTKRVHKPRSSICNGCIPERRPNGCLGILKFRGCRRAELTGFATSNEIHVAPGANEKKTLLHETAHVVQFRNGKLRVGRPKTKFQRK